MENNVLISGFTDENGNYYTLFYRIFFEEETDTSLSGYSIVIEKKSLHSFERVISPKITKSLGEVTLIAEKLCRNKVTPVTLDEVIYDYITEKSIV